MKLLRLSLAVLALAPVSAVLADTQINGTRTFLGTLDASSSAASLPCPVATSTPATCSVGMCFFESDATPGTNRWDCTATDTWTKTVATDVACSGCVSLTSEVSGTLPVANGGTNLTTATDDNVMLGNGTTWQSKAMPSSMSCTTQKLCYSSAANLFSTGTDDDSPEPGDLVNFDSSAEWASNLTDETGTGLAVFGTSPTLATPTITGYVPRGNPPSGFIYSTSSPVASQFSQQLQANTLFGQVDNVFVFAAYNYAQNSSGKFLSSEHSFGCQLEGTYWDGAKENTEVNCDYVSKNGGVSFRPFGMYIDNTGANIGSVQWDWFTGPGQNTLHLTRTGTLDFGENVGNGNVVAGSKKSVTSGSHSWYGAKAWVDLALDGTDASSFEFGGTWGRTSIANFSANQTVGGTYGVFGDVEWSGDSTGTRTNANYNRGVWGRCRINTIGTPAVSTGPCYGGYFQATAPATGSSITVPQAWAIYAASPETKGSNVTINAGGGVLVEDQKGYGSTGTQGAIAIASQTGGGGTGAKNNLKMNGGDYDNGHVALGSGHLWYDDTNNQWRVKEGAPTSTTDGAVLSMAGSRILSVCAPSSGFGQGFVCDGGGSVQNSIGTTSQELTFSRYYIGFTSAASSLAQAGAPNNAAEMRSIFRPTYQTFIRTDTSIANRRIAVGWNEAGQTPPAAATGPTANSDDHVLVVYDTGGTPSATNWNFCTGNGTNYSCVDTGVAVATSTEYVITIAWPSDGTVIATINGTSTTKTTHVTTDASAVTMGTFNAMTTLNSTAMKHRIARWSVERN